MQSGMEKLNSNVTVSEISGALQSGATPMDFITKNLRNKPAGETVINSSASVAANVVEQHGVVDGAKVPEVVMTKPVDGAVSQADLVTKEGKSIIDESIKNYFQGGEKPVEQQTEVAPNSENAVEDANKLEDVDTKKKNFFKELRSKVSTLETKVEEKDSELLNVKTRLEKYEAGEEIPEKLKPVVERAKNLEKFERLYEFDSSPEVQELYVAPIKQVKSELDAFAADYKIPADEMEKIASTTNVRERNLLLSEYCDPLGADQARRLIESYQEKKNVFNNARKEAESSLDKLLQDSSSLQRVREEERKTKVKSIARKAWDRGMEQILATESYPELTLKPGDDEHNAISKPILERSASEFGKVMNLLAEAGLKEIPEEAAVIIAKRFAWSEAAPIIAASRNHFYEEASKLINKGHTAAKYDRPPLGASVRDSGVKETPKETPLDARSAGRQLLNQIGVFR